MKKALLFSFIIIFSTLSITSLNSTENEQAHFDQRGNHPLPDPNIDFPETSNLEIFDSKKNGVQVSEWVTMDSLDNIFSFYGSNQVPIFADSVSETIGVIYRGWDIQQNENSLNNLFVNFTDDYGESWSGKHLIYDETEHTNLHGEFAARYPSLYLQPVEGSPGDYIIYFSGTIADNANNGGWVSYLHGIAQYNNDMVGNKVSLLTNYSSEINENTYAYGSFFRHPNPPRGSGLLDSTLPAKNVIGYGDGTTVFKSIQAVPVRRTVKNNFHDNNAISIISNNENVSSIVSEIPDKLKSENFAPSEQETGIEDNNRIVKGLRKGRDGNTYLSVFADFSGDGTDQFLPAITESNDEGMTWSDYDIFPKSKIDEYVENNWQGFTIEEYILNGFTNTDFVVNDINNYSHFYVLFEDNEATGIHFTQQKAELVELYKENGNYGVRKVGDLSSQPYFTLQVNIGGQNAAGSQTDYEIQVAQTYDGNGYVVKAVLADGVEPSETDPDSSYTYEFSNIHMSYRMEGNDEWSGLAKVVDENTIIKTTWLPNYIPNDMNDILVLRCVTEGDMSRNNQIINHVNSSDPQDKLLQYIQTARIQFSDLVDVEDRTTNSETSIESIIPNPASNKAKLKIFSNKNTTAKVEISDVYGNVVMSNNSKHLSQGYNYIDIDTQNFSQGTYYIKVTLDGLSVSDILKVIR